MAPKILHVLTTAALLNVAAAITPGKLKLSLKPANMTDFQISRADKGFKGIFNSITEVLKSAELDLSQLNISFACMNDTMKVIDDLETEDYARRFVDADAKIPYGILQGQVFWVGDYNECINITSTYNAFTGHSFKGRYLTARTTQLTIGFCMPDSCEKEDVMSLASYISDDITDIYTSDRKSPNAGDIVAIVICCLIVTIMIIGTSVDILSNWSNYSAKTKAAVVNGYEKIDNGPTERTGLLADKSLQEEMPSSPKRVVQVMKAFSFFSNTSKLMSTKTATGPLACLNGLRVISMFWVIQGHTYGFSTMGLKDMVFAETLLTHRFTFQAILNGTYSVDSFFFLSGLLVAYLALRELNEKGRINWIYYFAHRYWRLTPVYAICLMFFATVYTLLITGPFQWLGLDPSGPLYNSTTECRTYWWSNLLYINNLYPHDGRETNCFGWAWYLANDMQFYVFLSPIVVILLYKWKKIGVSFCMFLIIGCIVSRAVTGNYYGMSADGQISKHMDEKWAQGDPLYSKPYARWSVYIVGMLTGFILQKTRCMIRMNKVVVAVGWCLAVAMGMSVVYGLYHYHRHPDSVMPKAAALFYLSCARTAWSLALAWLVTACATGYGGWVNHILSWKLWAPLGRLTYGAYLVHPMVIFGLYLNFVAPLQFSDLMFVYIFVSNVVLSYGIAYLVSMAIEAPMMQLEKIILNKA